MTKFIARNIDIHNTKYINYELYLKEINTTHLVPHSSVSTRPGCGVLYGSRYEGPTSSSGCGITTNPFTKNRSNKFITLSTGCGITTNPWLKIMVSN
jgi:hypothetical protein